MPNGWLVGDLFRDEQRLARIAVAHLIKPSPDKWLKKDKIQRVASESLCVLRANSKNDITVLLKFYRLQTVLRPYDDHEYPWIQNSYGITRQNTYTVIPAHTQPAHTQPFPTHNLHGKTYAYSYIHSHHPFTDPQSILIMFNYHTSLHIPILSVLTHTHPHTYTNKSLLTHAQTCCYAYLCDVSKNKDQIQQVTLDHRIQVLWLLLHPLEYSTPASLPILKYLVLRLQLPH